MRSATPSKSVVWLVDDNDELRIVAESLFQNHSRYFFRSFSSAEEALDKAKQASSPIAILLDIEMPGMNGIEAIGPLRKLLPDTRIIILSSFDKDPYIREAFGKGVNGYLLKPFTLDDAVGAIEASLRNEVVVSSRIADRLRAMMHGSHPLARDYHLTHAEIEVLALLVRGFRRKQMAKHLNVSLATVKAHLANSYAKLGVENATAAVAKILKEHLLDDEFLQ